MPGLEGRALKDALIQKACQFGFQLAGVTSAQPPQSFSKFHQWIVEGKQAGMGMAYSPPGDYPGGVAAYARGADYHEVLLPRLQDLVIYLEAQAGRPVPNRYYTDTGPILERDLAQRAGLGWIGKNSMLIHPQQGSYFLLAEILLGIELPPDEPFTSDHCGICTRCLDNCPTGCILPDRTLDAGRCISYLTIENKGEIPSELREQLGEWLFGCDLCQQVCPWNRFALPEGDEQLSARPGVPPQNLAQELEISAEEFNRKFRGSPIKRAKRRGYLRNAAVVLGNRCRIEDASYLAAALQDPEVLLRQHAAWALGRIGGPVSRQALQDARVHETDAEVIGEIQAALSILDGGQSTK
jgi:epoxyqueuosine reductase